MEISNISDAEFKTLVIRILKIPSEHVNCIKKIQSETKDTLLEIKNNLRETTGEWTKPRINDLEHKKEENNPPELQEDKSLQKKNEDSARSL